MCSRLEDSHAKEKSSRETTTAPTSVSCCTGPRNKLVNSIDKIGFIQTTAVDDLNEPRTLNIFIVDENNQVVSGMETVCFDSDNDDMGKRTRDVTMKLMGTAFNRKNKYVLILENADSATEYGRYPITIDLAFQDDFF